MMLYFYFLDPILGESKIKQMKYDYPVTPQNSERLSWDGLLPELPFGECLAGEPSWVSTLVDTVGLSGQGKKSG